VTSSSFYVIENLLPAGIKGDSGRDAVYVKMMMIVMTAAAGSNTLHTSATSSCSTVYLTVISTIFISASA
jgi:hypothetical protein